MLSLLYGPTHISVHDCKENRIFDYTDLCPQSDVSAFKYAIYVSHSFISKEHLLISQLQSPSTGILRPRKDKICPCFLFSPSICHEVMGLVTVVLVLSLRFKRAFLLFSFTLIKRPFSSSSFMPLVHDLHIEGCWYLSWQSWFQLVLHPVQHFAWCTLHINEISRVTIYSLVLLSQFWANIKVQCISGYALSLEPAR